MQQVFVEETAISDKKITITGDDAHHLSHVLRMKLGEMLRVSSQSGASYICSVESITFDSVTCVIIDENVRDTEICGRIILFQALPKGDRLANVVEKATELGVSDIYPVAMDYCVTKWSVDKEEKKTSHYQALSDSAAKQSKRSKKAVFHSVISFDRAIDIAKDEADVILMPYENKMGMDDTARILNEIRQQSTVAIFIGPEGGFSGKEADKLSKISSQISLGRRILRTDTAAILAVGMVMLYMEMAHDIS